MNLTCENSCTNQWAEDKLLKREDLNHQFPQRDPGPPTDWVKWEFHQVLQGACRLFPWDCSVPLASSNCSVDSAQSSESNLPTAQQLLHSPRVACQRGSWGSSWGSGTLALLQVEDLLWNLFLKLGAGNTTEKHCIYPSLRNSLFQRETDTGHNLIFGRNELKLASCHENLFFFLSLLSLCCLRAQYDACCLLFCSVPLWAHLFYR